jgi:hypothetical protein
MILGEGIDKGMGFHGAFFCVVKMQALRNRIESYMDSSPIASQVLQKLMFSTEIEIAAIYSVSW